MNFKKKIIRGIIFVGLISTNNVASNDWLDKISEMPLVYPMIVQSAFVLGFLAKGLSSYWESNNTEKELTSITIKLDTLKNDVREIKTATEKIPEIENKINTFDERLINISSKIDPVFTFIQSSHATVPNAVKNLTEAIQLLHSEGLPEIEKRLNEKLDQKVDEIKTKIASLDSKDQIRTFNVMLENNNKELEIKLSAFILQSNMFMTRAADDINNAKTNAKEALKQIEELKKERLQLTALSQAPLVDMPFPIMKLLNNERTNVS